MKNEIESYIGELRTLREENEKLKIVVRHIFTEMSGQYFICGESGAKDEMGLPESILICPTEGSDKIVIYSRIAQG